MAIPDDLMDLSFGSLIEIGSERLILNGGDGVVRNILAFEGEEVEHRAERDVDLLVVAVGVAAADPRGYTDDLEAISVECDEGADGGRPGKRSLLFF